MEAIALRLRFLWLRRIIGGYYITLTDFACGRRFAAPAHDSEGFPEARACSAEMPSFAGFDSAWVVD